MSEQISAILKSKLDDLAAHGGLDAKTRLNVLKEELQYYVLNFIYHHPEYSRWAMYGDSALRVCYNLDRMSVDLDFEVEHEIENDFLNELKNEIESHFLKTYYAGDDFLAVKINNGRGVTLKFFVENLIIGNLSKLVHVKIDLNYFSSTAKMVTERIPQNHHQLSFVIKTYNLSTLMASKIAAIFLRGARGVGEAVYEEKGRDIYDLLWYMNKKAVPNFDYLLAKGIDVKNPRSLFDKLTLQMSKARDENLKHDLLPLFMNQTYIENWLKNWRESYFSLLDDYKIYTVTILDETLLPIVIDKDSPNDNKFFLVYWYNTESKESVRVEYNISDYWIDSPEGDLTIEPDKTLEDKMSFGSGVSKWSSRPVSLDKLKRYVTLFYQKTEKYFKKTNRIMLGNEIVTKFIRMTAENLNQKEEIMLNKSTLLSCSLNDLLK